MFVIHSSWLLRIIIVLLEIPQKNRSLVTPRLRRPDRAVYVPRARRSQTTPPPAAFAKSSPNNDISEPICSPTETNGWIYTARAATVISCDTELSSADRPSSDLVFPNQNHIATETSCQTNCDQSGIAKTAIKSINRLSSVNFSGGGGEVGDITTVPFAVTQVNTRMHSTRNTTKLQNGALRIEDAVAQPFDHRYGNNKDDRDEKELQRASKVSMYSK